MKSITVRDVEYIAFRLARETLAFDEPIPDNKILGKVCKIEKMRSVTKSKHINMESYKWRTINYVISLILLIKSTIYLDILIYSKKQIIFLVPALVSLMGLFVLVSFLLASSFVFVAYVKPL